MSPNVIAAYRRILWFGSGHEKYGIQMLSVSNRNRNA